jgi:3-hydroxy-3-methylglutaryl CoA synthase
MPRISPAPRERASAILRGLRQRARGAKHALAAIADCRLGAPRGKAEQQNGDGAVAFVLGSKKSSRSKRAHR